MHRNSSKLSYIVCGTDNKLFGFILYGSGPQPCLFDCPLAATLLENRLLLIILVLSKIIFYFENNSIVMKYKQVI